jgi:hypothetical protein
VLHGVSKYNGVLCIDGSSYCYVSLECNFFLKKTLMFATTILSRHLHIDLTQTDCKGSATSSYGIREFISVMVTLRATYFLNHRYNIF